MRVYVPPHWSRAISRVAVALVQYAPPPVVVVPTIDEADVVVIHVIGRLERVRRYVAWFQAHGQAVVLIQYVLRSTQKPTTAAWAPLWAKVALVWSYLPLAGWCVEEGTPVPTAFYLAPLGVDGDRFRPPVVEDRRYLVLTSGVGWLTESVRECTLAAQAVGGRPVHLGPDLGRSDCDCRTSLSDADLVALYQACQYVSGLRRTEGFELPAAEGLCCGARPLLFDRWHYRQWYGEWATYVPEGPRPAVEEALTALFRQPMRPVTEAERVAAAARFAWPPIIDGFWQRVVACVEEGSWVSHA